MIFSLKYVIIKNNLEKYSPPYSYEPVGLDVRKESVFSAGMPHLSLKFHENMSRLMKWSNSINVKFGEKAYFG